MERAVGEVFDFNGVKLQVKDTCRKISCDGCYFDEYERDCSYANIQDCTGYCYKPFRSDGKNVIFVEVEDVRNKED